MRLRDFEAPLVDPWPLPYGVAGVDPGKSGGVVLFLPITQRVQFFHVDPWSGLWWASLEGTSRMVRFRVYVEVPQNGTHASRGGVHWHAGMILGRMMHRLGNPQTVYKVTPREWRTVYGPMPKDTDWKVLAKQTATYYFPSIPQDFPDDVYEAAMIAVYGLETELRKQREKQQRKQQKREQSET